MDSNNELRQYMSERKAFVPTLNEDQFIRTNQIVSIMPISNNLVEVTATDGLTYIVKSSDLIESLT